MLFYKTVYICSVNNNETKMSNRKSLYIYIQYEGIVGNGNGIFRNFRKWYTYSVRRHRTRGHRRKCTHADVVSKHVKVYRKTWPNAQRNAYAYRTYVLLGTIYEHMFLMRRRTGWGRLTLFHPRVSHTYLSWIACPGLGYVRMKSSPPPTATHVYVCAMPRSAHACCSGSCAALLSDVSKVNDVQDHLFIGAACGSNPTYVRMHVPYICTYLRT